MTIVIVSLNPALAVRREDRVWSIFGVEAGPLGGSRMSESKGLLWEENRRAVADACSNILTPIPQSI